MIIHQGSETNGPDNDLEASEADRPSPHAPKTTRHFSIPGPVLDRGLLSKLIIALDARPEDFSAGDATLLKVAAEALPDAPPTGSEALQVVLNIASRQETMQLSVAGTPVRGVAVTADRDVQIFINVPADVEGGEALLLERRTNGNITVLSTHGLMHGDIVAEKEFVVPRPLAELTGTLLLDGPGSVELIAIFVRDRGILLRRHPLFQKTELDPEDYGRPVDLKPADGRDMRVLLRQILGIPASHWAVAYKRITVLGTINPRRSHNDPSVEPLRVHRRSARLKQPRNNPKKRVEMYEQFLELMQEHRDLVNRLASDGTKYSFDHVLLEPEELKHRWEMVQDLFLSETADKVTRAELIRGYAQFAHDAFGLRYVPGGKGKWEQVDSKDGGKSETILHRVDTYLDKIMKLKESHADPAKEFPKIDMALIALSHGLPLALLEAPNRDAFDHFANLERERRRGANSAKKPLLAFSSLDYLLADVQDTPDLQVYDDVHQAAEAGIRSARIELGLPPLSPEAERSLRAEPEPASQGPVSVSKVRKVSAGQPLWFKIDLPPHLQDSEALLFQITNTQGSSGEKSTSEAFLLSSGVAHGGHLHFGKTFESPTVSETSWTLGASENTSLVLFVAKSADLGGLPLFKRTLNAEASIELTETDLEDLKDCILGLHPEARATYRRQIKVA